MRESYRCSRCLGDNLSIAYHDTERGVPLHDEHKHFEMLVLETQQAGLSRRTILHRREGYRELFVDFDPSIIATRGADEVDILMHDKRIIRNKHKIESIIHNAQKFLDIQSEFGSFDSYIRGFTEGKSIDNYISGPDDRIITSALSDRIAKDLKARGFKFVGSTMVYARLQAIGIINAHQLDCHRYTLCRNLANGKI